jgi:predicted dehydrogenase
MASKFRFVDDVIEARRLIQSGAIGEPIIFENAFTSHVDMSGRWNSDPDVSGGGVLIDNGTHSADIVRYLMGPVTEVMAIEGKRIQHLAVEDTAKMFLRTTDGVMASVDLSWSLDKSLEHFIWVYGTEGELRVGWRESSLRSHTGDSEWKVFGSGYAKIPCMQAQLRNLCGALRDQEDLIITAEDALSSVGVIEAAYRSLPTSEWRSVTTRVKARTPATP